MYYLEHRRRTKLYVPKPRYVYPRAKKLLEAINTMMASVNQLNNGSYIKAEDTKSLEGLPILLSSYTNTLKVGT